MKRQIKWFWQRLTRGFDDRETWSLETTIAEYILPRLVRFKEINNCHPHDMTEKQWDAYLSDMIYAMRFSALQWETNESDWDFVRIENGRESLFKFYGHLWW